MLSTSQCEEFWRDGHVTAPDLFDSRTMDRAVKDVESWSAEFRESLSPDQHPWFLDGDGRTAAARPLRKLDYPIVHRPVFREIARNAALTSCVERLIGKGVSIFFSQVFLKPPEVGGPKPVHQDNFYFGPSDPNALLTAWLALDEATVENGCLHFGDGSHRDGVLPHWAPEGEPFNLQADSARLGRPMIAAPVPRGGVSFHHGNTLHQSSRNRSKHWRRAAAFHYLRNDASLVEPQLEYDLTLSMRITEGEADA